MIIQSMSGSMDAAGPGDLPLKSGISTSDLMGAEQCVVARYLGTGLHGELAAAGEAQVAAGGLGRGP
jgi:hypothetical protein